MTWHDPLWLLLGVPLVLLTLLWRQPPRALLVLRGMMVLSLLLALAGTGVRWPSRTSAVVVVADRSASMPGDSTERQKEWIARIESTMRSDQRVGVVAFGRQAVVEQPLQAAGFRGFANEVGADGSDLYGALEKGFDLLREHGGRLLVISDGHWNGRDPAGLVAKAAGAGIALDYRLLHRTSVQDTAIREVQSPEAVAPGQSFFMTAWVECPLAQEVGFEFSRGTTVLARGKKTMTAGLNRLILRDRAGEAGVATYTLRVTASGADPLPDNNQARILVGVSGGKPVLCVTEQGAASSLGRILTAAGLKVECRLPTDCQWGLDALARYAAVILENVPADAVGRVGLGNLAAWVEQTGSGLLLTGGKQMYGPGGYFKSPLDRILPVSMEMRQEHRKSALAIVVAMDRSGSMSMSAGMGRCKMDLANLGAVQVLDLMTPLDEFGVIAVDSSPHVIVGLQSAGQAARQRQAILRVGSQGGGIFIYEALKQAVQMLQTATAGTRHLILFADASDSEEPGDYRTLITKCRAAGITISVVGLGTPADCDANLLKDIASRGGGRCYFTDSAQEIPRLFAQETFTVARSTFVEEATPWRLTGALRTLGFQPQSPPPPLGGFNLCYLRPGAEQGGVTTDAEFHAPVIAYWRAVNGRVACFTGEADGRYTGAMAQWAYGRDLLASLARWAAGSATELPDNMLITQRLGNGVYAVELRLDPERTHDPLKSMPVVKLLRGAAGEDPQVETLSLQWKSPDVLAAEYPVRGTEPVLAVVHMGALGSFPQPPVCQPYSLEFEPMKEAVGRGNLARLAELSGGRECVDPQALWQEAGQRPRELDLWPWLVGLAMLLFLAEILQRRTRFLTGLGHQFVRLRPAANAVHPPGAGASDRTTPPRSETPRTKKTTTTPKTPASIPPTVPPASSRLEPPATPPPEPDSTTVAAMRALRRKQPR